MTLKKILFLLFLFISTFGNAQKEISYNAGFKTIHLIDSSRSYKPDTGQNDKLHYRPLDIDLWYPSQSKQSKRMLFEDLFRLHE
jgi:hypothetical protein